MNQYKILNLFPTPVFIDEGIHTTKKQRDFVYNTKWYRPEADNGWLTNNHYLLDEDVMKTLKEKIMKSFNAMMSNSMQFQDSVGWRMTNSWAVKHDTGGWAQEHIHTNSVFSGVYYMDTNEHQGKIKFHKPTHDQTILPLTFRPGSYKEPTDYNLDFAHIQPENGMLVIFPSTLLHSVSANKSEWDRYSIAFNFFPTGTWGSDEHELIL
tara:strand:+ start:757 stop:1383 length:627 start_codon:yes stop_codon:yes gene_type:complete